MTAPHKTTRGAPPNGCHELKNLERKNINHQITKWGKKKVIKNMEALLKLVERKLEDKPVMLQQKHIIIATLYDILYNVISIY